MRTAKYLIAATALVAATTAQSQVKERNSVFLSTSCTGFPVFNLRALRSIGLRRSQANKKLPSGTGTLI